MLARALTWGLALSLLGARNFAAFVAANFCANTARAATTIATRGILVARRGAPLEIQRQARNAAWVAEGLSLVAALTLLAGIGGFYRLFDRQALLPLLAMAACGLPARCNGPLRVAPKAARYAANLRAWFGLLTVGIGALVAPTPLGLTAALAAREWLTAGALAFIRPNPQPKRPPSTLTPAHWTEFVGATRRLAVFRFMHQAVRSTLHMTGGPFGVAVARILRRSPRYRRGIAPHPKIENIIPIAAPVGLAVAFGLNWFVPGPGSLVLSALALRIGLIALSTALWLRLSRSTTDGGRSDMDDLD